MSSKSEKELKQPDVFVGTSDKIFNYIEKHFFYFASVVGVVLLVSLSYVGYGMYKSSRESKASEALYAPEAELKKAEGVSIDEDPSKETKSKDFAKDYAPAVDKIKAAIRANSDTKAALVSALNLSYFLEQQKQFTLAQEVLELPTYHPAPGELLGGFWFMHRGLALLENNQVDPAISVYSSVLADNALQPFHAEALLKLGICYELKGDTNKARDSYERVGRDFPETEASTSAQQYLRLLQIKKQG